MVASRIRSSALGAAFLAAYLGCGWAALALAGAGGVSPWWLPSAVGMWLLVRRGAGWFPLCLLAEVVFMTALMHEPLSLLLVAIATLNKGLYLLPALWVRRRFGPTPDVRRLAVLLELLGAGAVGASLCGATGALILQAQGFISSGETLTTAVSWAAGDLVGVICLLPLLTAASLLASGSVGLSLSLPRLGTVLCALAVVVTPFAVFGLNSEPDRVVFLVFAPIMWASIRGGLLAASAAAFASNGVTTLMFATHGSTGVSLKWVQLLFLTLTVAALLLGGASDESKRMQQNLHQEVDARTNELRSANASLTHAAFHDGLTGLANRSLFLDRVEHAAALHERSMRPLSVIFCDLDDFKAVNDGLGHATGDELLVIVAERLRACVRKVDTLARLGGDEFAILLEDSASDPQEVAARITEALAQPVLLKRKTVHIGVSVGIAHLSADSAAVEAGELLARADVAMYAAKRAGKGRYVIWQQDLPSLEVDELGLRADLAVAIHEKHIDVVYQPIMSVVDGQANTVEALARWSQQGTAIPTAVFIPLAEQSRMLGALSDVVLDRALRDLPALRLLHANPLLRVSVNLAPEQLGEAGFAERVLRLLAAHGEQADSLMLELTERQLMLDTDGRALATLHQLARAGVHLALDDFGMGYSGLAALYTLPIDCVKIDRMFMTEGDSQRREQFLTGVVALAHPLGMAIVAEGIETVEQDELARRVGCDHTQGFLFGRGEPLAAAPLPAPRDALEQHLAGREAERPAALALRCRGARERGSL